MQGQLDFNIKNVTLLIGFIAPILMFSIIILFGFLQGDPVPSLVYMALLVVLALVMTLVENSMKQERSGSQICKIFNSPIFQYSTPMFNIALMAFTVTYVMMAALINTDLSNYIVLIVSLLGLLILEIVRDVCGCCGEVQDYVIGLLLGGGLGLAIGIPMASTEQGFFYREKMYPSKCRLEKDRKFRCRKVVKTVSDEE